MARPLPLPGSHPRNGSNGSNHGRGEILTEDGRASDHGGGTATLEANRVRAEAAELEHIRSENAQLRALCNELEQALQEAAQQLNPDLEQQIREYDAVMEEKNEMIRQLHQQLQESQAALEEASIRAAAEPQPRPQPAAPPCEDELLALSEELERERRQLQEDEQTLMEQMREMEVGMARERAEIARQRNDLQRLQSEIRHELERLERNGAVQSKIEELKSKLQDASTRRGAAPGAKNGHTPVKTPVSTPTRKEGLMGRWFGRGAE